MENALYDFYSLVDTYQKTQLVNKNIYLFFPRGHGNESCNLIGS